MQNPNPMTKEEIQAAILGLLEEFDSFCRLKGLRYSLAAGTLLGSVRHKGFIPWDDDIDVVMPRPDYEKLLKDYPLHSRGTRYRLVNWSNSPFPFPFTKLCDSTFLARTYQYADLATEYLWIDIFPLDGAPSDVKVFKSYLRRRDFKLQIAYCFTMKSENKVKQAIRASIKSVLSPFVKTHSIIKNIDNNAKKLSYDKSEYVAQMAWNVYGEKELFPRSYFDELVEVDFEGRRFLASKNWDEILTQVYGNYMQLPPVDQRSDHGIMAWKNDVESI